MLVMLPHYLAKPEIIFTCMFFCEIPLVNSVLAMRDTVNCVEKKL